MYRTSANHAIVITHS